MSLAFDRPPMGPAIPSSLELQAMGAHGALASVPHRAELMNAIGAAVGIPRGGWKHGQARLFENGDVRLVWLLRRLSHRSIAEHVAANLARAMRFIPGDLMLTIVTVARENSGGALTSVSMEKINTWERGGLDFLFAEKDRLGLPRSITGTWDKIDPFRSPETRNYVQPAKIPARDQVIAYAALLRFRYEQFFQAQFGHIVGRTAGASATQASRIAKLVWEAYAFLAPGGSDYRPGESVAGQSGQHFGCKTALQFLAHRAGRAAGDRVDLNEILWLSDFNHVEYVRSAKIRVAEALFLERMLTVTRELLPATVSR